MMKLPLVLLTLCVSLNTWGLNTPSSAIKKVNMVPWLRYTPLATQVAAKELEQGGNAIDAVIAAALTLGVVDGYNSGIGGGLFALVHWADSVTIDAREMAPQKARHRDMYIREGKAQPSLSREGALAIGILALVAAFEYLSTQGGKKPLSALYQQAAIIAEKGFILEPVYVKRLQRTAKS